MNKWILIILAVSVSLNSFSFEKTNFNFYKPFDVKPAKKHSPHKATIYSAILPGLGQAYNEKYWKIPLVYAAIGTSTYFMLNNRSKQREVQQTLNQRFDNDPNTNGSSTFALESDDVLIQKRNVFRANRDYSIIAMAAFYVINIVDATVDAHFYKFNIDKPLSERRTKKWNLYSQENTVGIKFNF